MNGNIVLSSCRLLEAATERILLQATRTCAGTERSPGSGRYFDVSVSAASMEDEDSRGDLLSTASGPFAVQR